MCIFCRTICEPGPGNLFSTDYWQHSCHTPLGHNSKWDKGFASNLRSTLFYPLEACQIPNSIPIGHYHSKHHFFFPAGSYDLSSTTGRSFYKYFSLFWTTLKSRSFSGSLQPVRMMLPPNPQWPTKCSVSVWLQDGPDATIYPSRVKVWLYRTPQLILKEFH